MRAPARADHAHSNGLHACLHAGMTVKPAAEGLQPQTGHFHVLLEQGAAPEVSWRHEALLLVHPIQHVSPLLPHGRCSPQGARIMEHGQTSLPGMLVPFTNGLHPCKQQSLACLHGSFAIPQGEVLPFDATHLHYGKGQTAADVELAPVSTVAVRAVGLGVERAGHVWSLSAHGAMFKRASS